MRGTFLRERETLKFSVTVGLAGWSRVGAVSSPCGGAGACAQGSLSTILTPRFLGSSALVSRSRLFCFKKSTASRSVASGSSIFSMRVPFNLRLMASLFVDISSFPASVERSKEPSRRIGRSHVRSVNQSIRLLVSLYAAS